MRYLDIKMASSIAKRFPNKRHRNHGTRMTDRILHTGKEKTSEQHGT
jgi:hypothetical protein